MGCSTGGIQLLRGLHSDFVAESPNIELGEFVYTTDPITFKIGDGVTPWSGLPVATREICQEPCVKTFRLYSKINYQYAPDMSDLPARSGMPMFDTQIDILPNDSFKITFENTITSAGTDVSPDDIQINGQKSTMVMINNTVVGSGSIFEGSVEEGGILTLGINDDNYEDNQGYYLVKYDDCACATNTCATTVAPTTTTTAAPTTVAPTTTQIPFQTTTTAAPAPDVFSGDGTFDEFGRCVAVSKNGLYLVVGTSTGNMPNTCNRINIYQLIDGEYVLENTIARPGTFSGSTHYNYQAVAISDNGILAASISRVHITNLGTPQQAYNNLEPEVMVWEKDNTIGGVWSSWKTSHIDTPTLLNLPSSVREHYEYPYDVQLVISSDGRRLLALQRGLNNNSDDQGLIGFTLDGDTKNVVEVWNLNGGTLPDFGNLRTASIAINKTGSSFIISHSVNQSYIRIAGWFDDIITWDDTSPGASIINQSSFAASSVEFNSDLSEDGNYIAVCRRYHNTVNGSTRKERHIYWYRRTLDSNGVAEWNEIYKEITLNNNQAAPCTDGDYDLGVKLTNNGKSLHVIGVAKGNMSCGKEYVGGGYYLNQTMFYDETSGVVTIHPNGDQQMIPIQGGSIRSRQRNIDTVNPVPWQSSVYIINVCVTEAGTIILGNPYDSTLGNPQPSVSHSDQKGTVHVVTNLNTTATISPQGCSSLTFSADPTEIHNPVRTHEIVSARGLSSGAYRVFVINADDDWVSNSERPQGVGDRDMAFRQISSDFHIVQHTVPALPSASTPPIYRLTGFAIDSKYKAYYGQLHERKWDAKTGRFTDANGNVKSSLSFTNLSGNIQFIQGNDVEFIEGELFEYKNESNFQRIGPNSQGVYTPIAEPSYSEWNTVPYGTYRILQTNILAYDLTNGKNILNNSDDMSYSGYVGKSDGEYFFLFTFCNSDEVPTIVTTTTTEP